MWPSSQHSSSPPRVWTQPIVSVSGVPSACSTAARAARPHQQLALIHHPSLLDGELHYKALQYKLYWSRGGKKRRLYRLLNHCLIAILHCAAVCTTHSEALTCKILLYGYLIPKHHRGNPVCTPNMISQLVSLRNRGLIFFKSLSALISVKAVLNLVDKNQ